jgi:hypothetical protein
MTKIKDSLTQEQREKLNTPLWRVGEKYYPIEEMDIDFVRKAIHHCNVKEKEHTNRLSRALNVIDQSCASLDRFTTLRGHLKERHDELMRGEVERLTNQSEKSIVEV